MPPPGHPSRCGRVLVVSHACAVPENQSTFAELAERGWDVHVVVPEFWRHEYAVQRFRARSLGSLAHCVIEAPVALAGYPQRHLYLCHVGRVLSKIRPDVVFLEEEAFSVSALQWAGAAMRRGIPFGVQAAENLDRPLPRAVRVSRSWVLSRAAFVAARSPAAGQLARRWGARARISLVPHAVPLWPATEPLGDPGFCIGFAGRLVPEKGVRDLIEAVRLLGAPSRLLFAGDGSLRDELRAIRLDGVDVEVRTGLSHGDMVDAYRQMDVLVLPSRTTVTWAEQFGRVLIEALWCGVPLVGSDSGAIPWVIATTGGGDIFPEGDVGRLARQLGSYRADPALRLRKARSGRRGVEQHFTASASAEALHATLAPCLSVHRWSDPAVDGRSDQR